MTKYCRGCGQDRRVPNDFYPSRPDRCKACLNEQQRQIRAKKPGKALEYTRKYERRKREERLAAVGFRWCVRCGDPIPDSKAIGTTKYCSRACNDGAIEERRRDAALRSREGRKCEYCQSEIPTTRILKAKYCSDKCSAASSEVQRHHRMARRLTHYAIKVGRLKKLPCEVCGEPEVEVHHMDYFEPLNVRFLCFQHHRTLMHGHSVKHKRKSDYGV